MNTVEVKSDEVTGTLINFHNWPLPNEVKYFISSKKRTFEPIRDLFICYLMIFSAWLADTTNPYWFMHIISCLVITSALVGLIALAHESFHDNIAHKKLNGSIARVFIALPLLMDYDFEKQIHLDHHKYLGTSKDPTLDAYNCSSKELWLRLISRFFLIGSIIWVIKKRSNLRFWKTNTFSKKRLFWNMLMICEQGSVFILFLCVNPLAYIWNWILPLILTSIFSSIREFGEHKSFDGINPICVANTHTNIVERLLISQFNFTHHAAHHLFPTVPYNYLFELTNLLNKHGWPPSKIPILIRTSYIKNLLWTN